MGKSHVSESDVVSIRYYFVELLVDKKSCANTPISMYNCIYIYVLCIHTFYEKSL